MKCEGSPSNLHLNTHWKHLPGNENLDEPKYVILDYIHHFIPQAKILITFRDPVDRLYSDYYHEYGKNTKRNKPNPRQFHRVVSAGVKLYQDCFKRRSVRSCVYEPFLYNQTKVQMQLGIYYIFWKDLTRIFPREQILVIQNKNLHDKETTMRRVYQFLKLRKIF
ncbi:carbohydrate sulfotransferase 15-like [Mercenaria mercenaria]|uniref:carbohydrate sulfotransferase 15-like n=1 Tax=Mercenaria mercenaria TaxID=6596 RepID=UPI00234EB163|nr:carbohydrate sulfotransferase 15-like [Mercenaria mercenaria]